MATPAAAALWLFLGSLPVCLWVIWSDAAQLRIPNKAVLALVVVFALVGLATLPPSDWAWRWSHLAVVLAIGIALNAAGFIGAGDAKFAAAMAPFVALGDWRALIFLYATVFLAAWALHRAARASIGPRLAPGWASWNSGRRFPMGVALAATLLAYLALAARA
jgi:prepilin peptidase CpaA